MLILVIVAIVSGAIVAGVFLVVRFRAPIFAIRETERPQDAIELWNQELYADVVAVTTEQLDEYPLDPTALSLRGFSRFYLAMQEVEGERRNRYLEDSVRDLRRVLLLPDVELAPQINYILGKASFHRGEFFYDTAIEALKRARTSGIERLDLLEYLALASRDVGRTDEAIEYFREVIDVGDEPVHRVVLADLLIEDQRYDEANELLRVAVRGSDDPTVVQDALLSLGESLRAQNRFNESIEVYKQTLEVNDSSAEAHYGIGEVYLAQGEPDRARFEWREAVRLNPNHIESLQRLQEY
ncbi:MAG: tetratricopeptide repeat protein [Alkalispirochaeta sp.]